MSFTKFNEKRCGRSRFPPGGWIDEPADMTEAKVAFRNFVNVLKQRSVSAVQLNSNSCPFIDAQRYLNALCGLT